MIRDTYSSVPTDTDCYCHLLPNSSRGELLARCNVCWNSLVEEKNRLVRVEIELLARLRLSSVSCQEEVQ